MRQSLPPEQLARPAKPSRMGTRTDSGSKHCAQRITHRQPELLSSPSPLLLPLLPPLAAASSSSSISWGLTVMWTTLGASWLNLESARGRREQETSKYLGKDEGRRCLKGETILHGKNIRRGKMQQISPFKGALSSSSFPNDINLIELGLDGLASHSVRFR